MSGAGDHTTGIHVSSWGWETDKCLAIVDGAKVEVETKMRIWRVSHHNKLVCYITLPEDKDSIEALMLASALVQSDAYELVFE